MKKKTIKFTGDVFCNQKFGGVSRYFVELAVALNRLDNWTATIESPLHINDYLKCSELRHRGIYLPKRPPWDFYALNQWLSKLKSRFQRSRPNVTHEMYYDARNLSRSGGGRVSTFYDMIHERFMPDALLLNKKTETFARSDKVIAISEATKQDMVHYLNVAPEKIDVVHLASSMRHTTHRDPMVPQTDYLLWVGSRHGYKNFEKFVVALVSSKIWTEDISLVCAGGIRPDSKELNCWQDLGLDPRRVQHCQPNEDGLASLYTNAQLLVYASAYEGFGIPPLEAMNCRCPVAASNVASIPEVVGNAGVLFDPNCSEEISEAIDSICTSSSLRESLIVKGVVQAKMFSWEKCAIETTRIYDQVATTL